MKISFDFDGCLGDNTSVQSLAKILVDSVCDVWILTSRNNTQRDIEQIYEISQHVGIPEHKIIFCPDSSKLEAIKEHSIKMHFDDDHVEVDIINEYFYEHHKVKPAVLVGFENRFMYHWFNKTLDQY